MDNSTCPYCKSGDLTGDSIDIDGQWASQRVDCLVCDRSWLDHYKISFRSDPDTGDRVQDVTGTFV